MPITTYDLVQESRLFIAMLGEAPDGAGLSRYAYGFNGSHTTNEVASWMFYEIQPGEYPSSMTNAQVAATFYEHVYGHAPDSAALAPWQARLDAYETPSDVLVDMVDVLLNYSGSDSATLASRALFNNKVQVAMYYGEYGGDADGASVVLQGVTSDPASVLAAIHAMKGHYNIPADAADPAPAPGEPIPWPGEPQPDPEGEGTPPAPAPGPVPAPAPEPAPAPAPEPAPAPSPAPAPDPVVKHGLPEHATELAQLYLAYFGRPMDWAGIDYYTGHGTLDLFSLTPGFSASPESQALYGQTFGAAQVDAIYENLFGRHAEQGGIDYWTGVVHQGLITPAGAALAILLGAQNDDKIAVQNKMEVALAFAAHVDTQSEVDGYSGVAAASLARDFLRTVDASPQSVAAAIANVDAEVAAATHAQIVGVAPVVDHTA